MMDLMRKPDCLEIETDEGFVGDAQVTFDREEKGLAVRLTASSVHPRFVKMRWENSFENALSATGDEFERLQSDACFGSLDADRYFAWYFLVKEKGCCECGGVKTHPHAFVSFSVDPRGVNAFFDVRNGGEGVDLRGRVLPVATLISNVYPSLTAFNALRCFCSEMCSERILPKEPVYGGNDWYYSYGKSTGASILDDAKLLAELSDGNVHRPYMVIDDGWERGACGGPWQNNERFGDLATLTENFATLGVKAGIWIRFLHNEAALAAHPDWAIQRRDADGERYLDPSLPGVIEHILKDIRRIKSWGFTLIKHDYSGHDMFGLYGYEMNGAVCEDGDWNFGDKTRTNAEICMDFYQAIKEECGPSCLVEGCDVFSHLATGYCELNRIGDDTSGVVWDRTRSFGVNSLAFRLPQNGIFYACDADCVGFAGIPFEKNALWLDLLSRSGTPLFISCPSGLLTIEQKAIVHAAFQRASIQKDDAIPLDFETSADPVRWSINGGTVLFDWQRNEPPTLLKRARIHSTR
jgi:alpha-galactosidase